MNSVNGVVAYLLWLMISALNSERRLPRQNAPRAILCAVRGVEFSPPPTPPAFSDVGDPSLLASSFSSPDPP
ncbi:hypothetical protein KC19_VG311100 [Ceratodon purpureus]|uniref:Secreted protein n=1 Tax=Ceratodon purpureus TaxID=3225 RepID=A0A8T0HWG1_CERPU|nr:hypothetical protein KC19_VG311100 [Ceratodon purpureus]